MFDSPTTVGYPGHTNGTLSILSIAVVISRNVDATPPPAVLAPRERCNVTRLISLSFLMENGAHIAGECATSPITFLCAPGLNKPIEGLVTQPPRNEDFRVR